MAMYRYYIYFIFIPALVMTLGSCQSDHSEDTPKNDIKQEELIKFMSVDKDSSGVLFNNRLETDSYERNIYNFNYLYNGAGVAVGDLDGDDLPELFFTGNDVPNVLYKNLGNLRFEDVSLSSGISAIESWNTGVQFADVNGDGLLDIYVCRGGWETTDQQNANLLYINKGDLKFEEKAKDFGIDDPGFGLDAVFFDMENDGDLDLYITNRPDQFFLDLFKVNEMRKNPDPRTVDQLYRNEGNGRFTNVTSSAGIRDNFGFGLAVTAGDLTGDGLVDLYIANDFLEKDYFYKNLGGGKFAQEVENHFRHIPFYSMGTDLADLNQDGLEDLFVVEMLPEDYKRSKTSMASMNVKEFEMLIEQGQHYQYMHNMLQYNRGGGKFSEISQYSGLKHTDWSWACLLEDLDNDGDRDVFVANGYKKDVYDNDANAKLVEWEKENAQKERTPERLNEYLNILPANPQANYFYENAGNFKFKKKNVEWGIEEKSLSNGAIVADLDRDGDLDIAVNNIDKPAYILENHSNHNNKYIRIQLNGPALNTEGLGSVIKLHSEGSSQVFELKKSRGYLSCQEGIAHFGLGNANEIHIEVFWPDGRYSDLTTSELNRQIIIDHKESVAEAPVAAKRPALLKEVMNAVVPEFMHGEKVFDDYRDQVLLPHKMSQLGPMMSTGDVNGDGMEDLFVGGAKDQAGAIYLAQGDGTLKLSEQSALARDAAYEDMGSVFFDIDGDSDLDLYVVSGGNEYPSGSGYYQDRLYINDGQGGFSNSNLIPTIDQSGSIPVVMDFDLDGDLDLFVGGRQVPNKYPYPARSYLLQNNGGKFSDVTEELAQNFMQLGMVTDGQWVDLNNDGVGESLILVGEWMEVKCYEYRDGKFVPSSIEGLNSDRMTGWWWSIVAEDLDNDGDLDFVLGNMGKNHKFKASSEKPFEVYCDDFDDNGTYDVFLAKHLEDRTVTVRGKAVLVRTNAGSAGYFSKLQCICQRKY